MSMISRRSLFASGMMSPAAAAWLTRRPDQLFLFETERHRVHLTLEFHDNYASQTLGFRETVGAREFCVSSSGQENRNCIEDFTGSVAVARYRVLARGSDDSLLELRESVRDIDRSDKVPYRPRFDRAIPLLHGTGSDIQVFGYSKSARQEGRQPADEAWCLFRQDLYLDPSPTPFLVLHWKHQLSAIRVLDFITGLGTRQLPPAAAGRRDQKW